MHSPARALVLGLYPSACHVAGTAPIISPRQVRTGKVAALAIGVEPKVFWDGDPSNFSQRLARWNPGVGFVEGDGSGLPRARA